MTELKKNLGLVELVFFGIGAIIGTGIFVIPAIASNIAGVASFWVWLQLGTLTIFMAFSIAELASIYPHAGGPYKFVKEAFGDFAGFLSGWIGWLISWVTMASLAVAVSYYLQYFIELSHTQSALIAISMLALVTIMNFHGLHWGIRAQIFLTTISILVLWFYITWGVHFIDLANFRPTPGIVVPSLFVAAVFVIEPFIGWETMTYFAEESKNPTRDIPRAIVYSSVFVTVLYSAVIFVTLGLTANNSGDSLFPLAAATGTFLGAAGGTVVAIGAIAVLLACLNSWAVASARLPYAIAKDGLFPTIFASVHKKHATPHMSLIIQFVFASAAVMLGGFEEIISILVALAMIMYIMVFFSIPIHRMKHKHIPYKLPLKGLVPMISSLIAIGILILIPPIFLLITVGLILIGAAAYRFMPLQQLHPVKTKTKA